MYRECAVENKENVEVHTFLEQRYNVLEINVKFKVISVLLFTEYSQCNTSGDIVFINCGTQINCCDKHYAQIVFTFSDWWKHWLNDWLNIENTG